jgi:uncharacterized membrane protein YphA (DoxX/SURF4 family)
MILRTIYIVTRYFLGLLFLATGIGKLLDNRGFAQVIETYWAIVRGATRDEISVPLSGRGGEPDADGSHREPD